MLSWCVELMPSRGINARLIDLATAIGANVQQEIAAIAIDDLVVDPEQLGGGRICHHPSRTSLCPRVAMLITKEIGLPLQVSPG